MADGTSISQLAENVKQLQATSTAMAEGQTKQGVLMEKILQQLNKLASSYDSLVQITATNQSGGGTSSNVRVNVNPRNTGIPEDGELQVAAAPEKTKPALPPLPLAARTGSTALVEYNGPVLKEEEEDLEVKLRRILENVPVRVSNTSGSSAGSGSGDFH